MASGRRSAYGYGWGPEFDIEQDAFRQPRVPRRMLERATEAYRQGKLGIAALAKLQGRPVAEVQEVLAEAGVVARPVVRRADISRLTARAMARKSLEMRSDS